MLRSVTMFVVMVSVPLSKTLWALLQCDMVIDLWPANSPWVRAKVANGTTDESVGTIGMRSNLSKLVRGFGRCCSTLLVSTERLTLTRILRCRMHTSYTLLGNAL